MKVVTTGPAGPAVLQELNQNTRCNGRGILYESGHRHADKLVEELQLEKKQVVITSAIRKSLKVCKNGKTENGRGGSIGEGSRALASARQTSSGQGKVRGGVGRKAHRGHVAEKHDVEGGAHPQPSAGQEVRAEGACRVRASPAHEDRSTGERMTGEEAMRYRAMDAGCKLSGCERPDTQYAMKEASMWMPKPCRGHREKEHSDW